MITLAPCMSPAPISSTSEADLRSAPICHAHRRTSLCIHSATSWCRTWLMRSCKAAGTWTSETGTMQGALPNAPLNAPLMIAPNDHDAEGDELSAQVSIWMELQRDCSFSDATDADEDAVEDATTVACCGSADGFCRSVMLRCKRQRAQCSLHVSRCARCFGSRGWRWACGGDVLYRGFLDLVALALTRSRTDEKLAGSSVESRSVRVWCGELVFGSGASAMLDRLICGVFAALGMNMCGVLRTELATVALNGVKLLCGVISANSAGLGAADRPLEVM